MNLKYLSSGDLKQIGKLLRKREALMARVEKVDRRLSAYETGDSEGLVKAGSAAPRKRRKLKEAVVELLKKGGKEGVTVKEVAVKLGVDPNRIYTWFYSTGSRIKDIKKVGEAKYAWVG